MNFAKIPLLAGLAARLDFLGARSSVIAENIANADTPDYAAKDLKKPDFAKLATRASGADTTAMRVSDPRHIAGTAAPAPSPYTKVAAPDGEASLTGNRVSVETQAMKLSATRQDYALATSLYRKGLGMLRLAARGQ